jgi:NADH-quinone oxidoreductase subunit H
METSLLIETLIKMLVVVLIFSGLAGVGTYFERKVLAFMQRRLGPMVVGPYGILQFLADAIKLFTKEDIVPTNSVRSIFMMAPLAIVISVFVAFTAVPIYPEFTVFDYTIRPIIIDVNVGLLFALGVMAVGMYTPLMAGMASGNKWSIIGAARTVVQLLSFEVVTGLSALAPLMMIGSLSLIDITTYQAEHGWMIWSQPVAFVLFMIAGFAETNRTPFDLTEHEAEVIGGYHTEYSGMRWGMMMIGEYAEMFLVAFLVSIMFLGGFGDLGEVVNGTLEASAWGGLFLILKVSFFFFFFLWTRAAWPHVRPDQLMWLCWKVLMPLAVVNVVITGIVMMA